MPKTLLIVFLYFLKIAIVVHSMPTRPPTSALPTYAINMPGQTNAPKEPNKLEWLTQEQWDELFPHPCTDACTGCGKFTYENFVRAARDSPGFASSGDEEIDKIEVAAFLAETSHETTGGWAAAPDGADHWGYCFYSELAAPELCSVDSEQVCLDAGYSCKCYVGKRYYGRGPIQLSWNYNYGLFSHIEFGNDNLVRYPDLLESHPHLGFKAAIWFWMTPQAPKPSCHEVITDFDGTIDAAGRGYDFAHCTDIINGGYECGQGKQTDQDKDRGSFYRRYLKEFGVSDSRNTNCANYQVY